MPEGVDASKMMQLVPDRPRRHVRGGGGEGGMTPEMIDGLIAMANAPQQ